ncbi:MAG: hypothetical protein OEY28_14370, partial [Nitrospira sp.]|nr:hypothetical protein [Nitrospira sp.]
MASKKSENAPLIEFTVSMPRPLSHNFKVTAKVSGDEGGEFKVAFAAWTPGSYKIRDFARNVSDFGAAKGAKFELLDKQSYRLTGAGMVEFSYTLYADELSVRTPHLDDTHGFFLGSNLFPYLVGEDGKPAPCRYRITVVPYGDWKVATSLEPVRGVANCWQAPDYDILADTPFEIGTHSIHSFTAFGVKHRVAFYGWGNFDEKRIVADTEKVVNKIAAAFGGVPYSSYLFINHFTPDSGGGLEHLNSCVCAWPSFKNVKEDDYQRFIRLVSHEYFHVFNVKRIRPEILGPFDYSKEQH